MRRDVVMSGRLSYIAVLRKKRKEKKTKGKEKTLRVVHVVKDHNMAHLVHVGSCIICQTFFEHVLKQKIK